MDHIDINTVDIKDKDSVVITIPTATFIAIQQTLIDGANALITQKRSDLAAFTTFANNTIVAQETIIAEAQALIAKVIG